jgi:predicted HTH domain antitoxin
LLILFKTMTALYHANSGRPFAPEEIARRTPLADAVLLYDLRIVSLGTAAHIARVSVSEFIEALGKAGVSVFRYGPDEVLAEVAEAQRR